MQTVNKEMWLRRRHQRTWQVFGPLWGAKAMLCRFLPDDAATPSEIAPVAQGQGDTGQVAAGQPTGEVSQVAAGDEKGPIPYERFHEVNERLKASESKLTQYEQYLLMQQQQASQQQRAQQPADPFKDFCQREGIGKDGWVTPEDLAKVSGFFQQQNQQQLQQQEQENWYATHPDYSEVVTTPAGQASAFLQQAMKDDPTLGRSLRQNWDPQKAYYAALAAKQRQSQAPAAPQVNLQQIQQGKRAPQGISAAQGGGGQATIGDQMRAMTDDQVREYLRSRAKVGS